MRSADELAAGQQGACQRSMQGGALVPQACGASSLVVARSMDGHADCQPEDVGRTPSAKALASAAAIQAALAEGRHMRYSSNHGARLRLTLKLPSPAEPEDLSPHVGGGHIIALHAWFDALVLDCLGAPAMLQTMGAQLATRACKTKGRPDLTSATSNTLWLCAPSLYKLRVEPWSRGDSHWWP